jgi:ribosomal protein S18 acetylase RimI-like enzyme
MIRRATAADREAMHELYREFFAELPPPAYTGPSIDQELGEVDDIIEDGLAFIAEEDGQAAGFALASRKEGTRGFLSDIYVGPPFRRRGLAGALITAVAEALEERGATHLTLSVKVDNSVARAAYAAWGFDEHSLTLVADIGELRRRAVAAAETGPSFGSVHVQTDDIGAVARAVGHFIPRLPGRSQGTVVSQPRNGWVAVYDEAADRQPELLGRIARELSDRMGAVTLAIGAERGQVVRYLLYERGRMVDEYLSVPEHYGSLPPGDAVALGANPTVVARLTGADPKEIRSIARTAASPADLPPAGELLAQLATAMKIEGAEHGYDEGRELPGAKHLPE